MKVIGEEETLDAVLAGKSIARFGDGELNNLEGKKCVPQLNVSGLADELRNVIRAKDDRCIVGIPYASDRMPEGKRRSWEHYVPRFAAHLRAAKQYYSAFISRPDSAPWIATPQYFEKVQSIWKDQEVALVWGGYRSLYPEFLRKMGAKKVHSVLCSYEDAYAQIDQLERQVLATGAKRVILCAGPTATCLAARLSAQGVHAIDLGHIALFWQYAGGEQAIKIAPVTVLPPVEQTKAQIKEYGAVDERRVKEFWWPRCDNKPEDTAMRQQFTALAAEGHIHGYLNGNRAKVAVVVGAGAGPLTHNIGWRFERVYAFEPDFGMFGALRRNLPIYGDKNVAFYKEAVGDAVGTVRMLPGAEAGQWKVDNEKGFASVMQTTIDAMELDACDVLITNVGEYHDKVIVGARETIAEFSPKVIKL